MLPVHSNRARRCPGAWVLLLALALVETLPALAERETEPDVPATHLVKLEVTAMGPHGGPVTDLRSGECQVAEDGKTQTTSYFHFDGNRRETVSLGPRESSNRTSFAHIHPTIILLDLLSERVLTWAQSGQELVKSLQRLESDDAVYLYVLTNRGIFYPLHPLPRGEPDTRAAQTSWTQQIGAMFDVVSRDLAGFRPLEDHDPGWRTQLTIQALRQFASQLAVIPGRKNVVWITHGIPSAFLGLDDDQMVDISPQLHDLGETFAQANTALYTVAQSASGAEANMGSSFDTLGLLSSLTGGRAYASDNIEKAIAESMTDMRGSYLFGYYPRRQRSDGKFHKLRVTCSRKGVHIQAKQGYWAMSNSAEEEQSAIETSAAGPFDDPTIGLHGTIARVIGTPQSFRLQIRVDVSDLLLHKQNDRYIAQLTLAVVAYSEKGSQQHFRSDQLQLSLTPEEFEQAAKDGFEITRDLAADGPPQKIRIGVLDRGSNLTGSLTMLVTRERE
jgi:VWFA-related protein